MRVAQAIQGTKDGLGRYDELFSCHHLIGHLLTRYIQDYDPEDLKGESEPAFSLDRALKAHKIDDRGIEMEDRTHIGKDYHAAERNGTLDRRDPVEIAGDDGKYVDLEMRNGADTGDVTSFRSEMKSELGSLKKRIGSLAKRNKDRDDD